MLININYDIKKIRENKGLNQQQFADAIGITREMVGQIERGQKKISKATAILINEFLKIDKKVPFVEDDENSTGYYYPNVKAAAGFDKEGLNKEIEKIPVSIPNWGRGLDFINVFGDSMYPKFNSGEIIGIKEIEKQYLNYGYAYVIQFNDGEVYLKYIKKGKDDKHWLLVSENDFYEPKEFPVSAIKSVFIIKGVISKITM